MAVIMDFPSLVSHDLSKEITEGSEFHNGVASTDDDSRTQNASYDTPPVSKRAVASAVGAVLGLLKWVKTLTWRETQDTKPEHSNLEDEDLMKPMIRNLEDAPWGFPRLARYANSDESFMIYRRFGELFARVLHGKQSELAELEEGLRGIDMRYSAGGKGKDRRLMSREWNMDEVSLYPGDCQTRQQLLDTIGQKLIGYSDLLARAEHMAEMKPPSNRDRISVTNFLNNEGGQVVDRERKWILEKEDLVRIKTSREYAWLDDMLENILRRFRCSLFEYIFCSKETRLKTSGDTVRYYSRERISTFATLIITVFIGVLLIIPVYLLWRLAVQDSISNSPETLSLLVLFTLFFSAIVSTFTKAKRHEILAASAGYCALLVVFMSNVNTS